MIVRCTKKMLDLLGGRSVSVGELPATDDDWYLDLIWFDRRKCLLLVHAGTLFSVFRADVRSPRLRRPARYLLGARRPGRTGRGAPTAGYFRPTPTGRRACRKNRQPQHAGLHESDDRRDPLPGHA